MALNKFMHPRNIYKNKKPDFKALAIKYPEFRKHVTQDLAGKVYLDFKKPLALRALTTVLLKEDFSLDVDLPIDRLIPTIPLRLNYIHWIEDILGEKSGTISGVDIGTGCCCVYPLLACKLNNWMFQATDVDEENIHFAQKNVEMNGLSEMIKVTKVPGDVILMGVLQDSSLPVDFCMCNPPFFSDHLEAQAVLTSRKADRPEPSSINTAGPTEAVAHGGEVGFVKKMIRESLELQQRVRVYTTMLGKKSSVPVLKEELRRCKISSFTSTEFCQGKTMRWGLAWTFDQTIVFPDPPIFLPYHPAAFGQTTEPAAVSPGGRPTLFMPCNEIQKSQFQPAKKDNPVLSFIIPRNVPSVDYSISNLALLVSSLLNELKIRHTTVGSSNLSRSWSMIVKENTWSNQRRKRRQQLRHQQEVGPPSEKPHENSVGSLDEQGFQSSRGDNSSCAENIKYEDELVSQSPNIVEESKIDLNDSTNLEEKNNCSKEICAKKAKLLEEGLDDIITSVVECASAEKISIKDTLSSTELTNDIVCNSDTPAVVEKIVNLKEKQREDSSVRKNETENCETNDDFLFKCIMGLSKINDNINLEMKWEDGHNKEHMHQVLQFMKNRLK